MIFKLLKDSRHVLGVGARAHGSVERLRRVGHSVAWFIDADARRLPSLSYPVLNLDPLTRVAPVYGFDAALYVAHDARPPSLALARNLSLAGRLLIVVGADAAWDEALRPLGHVLQECVGTLRVYRREAAAEAVSKPIIGVHPVVYFDKAFQIAQQIHRDGWQGRPLVVMDRGDYVQAYSGTHRLFACAHLGRRPTCRDVDVHWSPQQPLPAGYHYRGRGNMLVRGRHYTMVSRVGFPHAFLCEQDDAIEPRPVEDIAATAQLMSEIGD